MANVLVDEQVLTGVADAIRLKCGSTDRFYPSQMSEAILQIPQTGGSPEILVDENKEIRFFDYDGTLLYSYSLEELARLEDLPDLPTTEGLICEGWNWDLADLKALNRNMDVGAMYVTDDGATRIYVELNEYTLHPYLTFGQNANQGILIDWGDGSELQGYDGTSTSSGITVDHLYQRPGKYTVRLIPQGDTNLFLYGNSAGSKLWHDDINTNYMNLPYQKTVKKIELGKQISNLGSYCFSQLIRLKTISMSKTVQYRESYMFMGDWNLNFVVFSMGWGNITHSTCKDCTKLKGVSIPNGIPTMSSMSFQNCRTLKRIELPDSITKIYSGAFNYCESLERFYMPDHIQKDIGSILMGNRGLEDYHLSNDLVELSASALTDLYSLKKVVIPAGVTKIGRMSLSRNLSKIYILATTPPVLELETEFQSILADFKVYVPAGSLEAYQTATGWCDYADKIFEMEEV